MWKTSNLRKFFSSDLGLLLGLSLAFFVLHMLTNGQYGWHRDELAMLDDARFLDWGYVAYPPLTPLIARFALTLFGPSLVGVRMFSALSSSLCILLTGLMARELGGRRLAQLFAASLTAIAPVSLATGITFMYVTFDFLWWVTIAYCVLRLLKSENPRWWLAIGGLIGLGMMTKYTILYLIAGLVAGVLLTPVRRWLRNPWLWAGVGLSLLIFLPNMLWQVRHNFISLEFLSSIHARDVRIGRTSGFFLEQFLFCASLLSLPWWLWGLRYYFFDPAGKRYRLLGWMYVIPLILFIATQGRSYYLAPAYPMLFAAGAVAWEAWLSRRSPVQAGRWRFAGWGALAVGAVFSFLVVIPFSPVNSSAWKAADRLHDIFREEIGWPELVESVAAIYNDLPAEEQTVTGILTTNYGEAGAINLYGSAYGLPQAISGVNSYWLRGPGDPPPQTLIVLGATYADLGEISANCKLAGHISNRYGVLNEESRDHPDIFLCRNLRVPWHEIWPQIKWFG
jgi:4-amino-4-deoxy-L-arabinose transferase-like glycosyltransferase